jgi:hypothetical protein
VQLVLLALVVLGDARLRSTGSVGERGGLGVQFVPYVVSFHFSNGQLADKGFLFSLALPARLAVHTIHSACEAWLGWRTVTSSQGRYS